MKEMSTSASDAEFSAMMSAFGAGPEMLDAEERAALRRDGFLVIQPDKAFYDGLGVSLGDIRDLLDRMTAQEGWRGGGEGREDKITPDRPIDPGSNRLKNLINKASVFRRFISHPKVLAAVYEIIGRRFKSSGVEMRSPRKGGGEQQVHIDWLPRMQDDDPYSMVIVGFYIDGMSAENGALRVVPGTHTRLDWPNEYINVLERQAEEIQVEIPPGAIVVLNSHTWHAGARNLSGAPRRTLYVDYRDRLLGQALNQKYFLSPDTVASLSEPEKYLLAVRPQDPTDETLVLGMGAAYRERYGDYYMPMDEADTGDDVDAQASGGK